jgi:hypothetical protein
MNSGHNGKLVCLKKWIKCGTVKTLIGNSSTHFYSKYSKSSIFFSYGILDNTVKMFP